MKKDITKKILFISMVLHSVSFFRMNAGEDKYVDEDYVEIYSHKSTLYTTLQAQKYGFNAKYKKVEAGSNIYRDHRFSEIAKRDYLYQNLGIAGSASKDLYEHFLIKSLGVHTGYNAYDLYLPKESDIKFFDTKSPYVDADIALARYGSFCSSVLFSRNINPLWNIGASTRFMVSQKEFLENSYLEKSDRGVISFNFSSFSSFTVPSKKYSGLTRVFFSKHRIRESGGIYIIPGYKGYSMSNTLFLDEENSPLHDLTLTNRINPLKHDATFSHPENVEKIFEWLLYQQFHITSSVAIYLDLNLKFKENFFEYRNREEDDEDVKGRAVPSLASFQEEQILKENLTRLGILNHSQREYVHFLDTVKYSGEVGVKFQISKIFMMPYYRFSRFEFKRGVGNELKSGLKKKYLRNSLNEHFLGIYTSAPLKILKRDQISIHLEYLLKEGYMAKLSYTANNFNISLSTIKASPSLMQEEFHWYGRNWKNEFEKIYQHSGSISYNFKSSYLDVRPFCNFSWIKNPVYFQRRELTDEEKRVEDNILSKRAKIDLSKETLYKRKEIMKLNPTPIAEPKQKLENLYFCYLGTNVTIKFWKIVLNSFFSVSKEFSSLKIIKTPTLVTTHSIFYEHKSLDNQYAFIFGVDMHYKSDYQGDGYDPVIQQFFLQDDFMLFAYPIFDIFVNFRVGRVRIFVKWSHVNEFLHKSKGYFSSPFYPGNKMALDIGVKWSFFD